VRMSSKDLRRAASHAGSWYAASGEKLSEQLEKWLSVVDKKIQKPVRGLIGPHAGYSYSGPPAAFAYKYVDFSAIERIFILGPSHHVYLSNCALSKCSKYQTPLGDLILDKLVIDELQATNQFGFMDQKVDEDEHSIEMHLPYIYKMMQNKKAPFTIVPILVGKLSPENEELYGVLLSKYLADPKNLFVISSDFCHWGQRFSYTRYDPSCGEIFKSIEKLDRSGMKIIEEMDPTKFHSYIAETKNTICGRHPIGVFMNSVRHLNKENPEKYKIEFTTYAQSNQVTSMNDSSVSYAAAVCYLNF